MLRDTSKRLGEWHAAWKRAENAKNELRRQFFKEITEELQDELAPQAVEKVEAKDEEEALRIAQRRYPRHVVKDLVESEPGEWNIILEENPEFRSYKYVNPEDGQVYQRVVAEGSPYLDDDALQEENPQLWERITQEQTQRVLRPLEELSAEDLAAVQPYITTPPPSVRLPNPRAATKEELDENNY